MRESYFFYKPKFRNRRVNNFFILVSKKGRREGIKEKDTVRKDGKGWEGVDKLG